jgi:DNA-nicking Smr family endonuclease
VGHRSRQRPPADVARPERRTPLGLSDLGALRDRLRDQEARRLEAARQQALRREVAEREARLFRDAVADVAPLGAAGRISRSPPPVEPLPRQTERDERAALAESLSDEIDVARLLEHDERLSFRRPGIGEDTLARLRRGQWAIQGRLDLHGLRSDQAREAVARFLPQAVRDGLRCVRIIHGKGLGSIERTPVLKDKVLRWLVQRDEVIAFCQAPPFAGGTGALLVLLRAPGPVRRP